MILPSHHIRSVAMVAGEASGDLLASRMLSGLRPALPDTHIHGIGGPKMAEYGFVADWPMEKLSVMGLFEVLKHYREIKGIRDSLRDKLLAERPAVFVGVDSPDFNLGLEMLLKQAGIPTVHFVSPSVWAWRSGRIKKIARAVSHMLVVFPFEEAIYREAGIPVTYVGHPLAEVIPIQPDVAAARIALSLPQDAPVVALLPGSRMSELRYLTAAFVGAAKILAKRDPSIRFVAPMAGEAQSRLFAELREKAGLQDVPIQILQGQSHTALAAADAVLVASGTATLEVALYKKPMVIAYKIMRATWEIARHMVSVKWCGMPNILSREMLVPEFLQNAVTSEALADALWFQLNDETNRKQLVQRFTDMHYSLLRDTAQESAQAVLRVMSRP